MGEIIEVRLSDVQHRQLMDEARAAGQKFFDYCRSKLTTIPNEMTEPKPVSLRVPPQLSAGRSATVQVAAADAPAKVAEFAERLARLPQAGNPADERIARIEDAVARLTEFVLQGHQPAPEVQQPAEPFDVDSIVNSQFEQAEAAGLTEHVPDVEEELMLASGVRPISRRPMPFSAHSGPKHLQQLLG